MAKKQTATQSEPIIEIDNLHISFFTKLGESPADMDFSMTVMPGECMGLVGESGCGKSILALAIMRDLPGTGRITRGRIKFRGRDMSEMPQDELRQIRGSENTMVHQEQMASPNPSMRIADQLMEVPMIHEKVSKAEARKRAFDMVKAVKLPETERMLNSYPHQLSGSQQQRIVIAMAFLSKPALLLLDEPMAALDVSVQAAVTESLMNIQRESKTTMVFISHDLSIVRYLSDRVIVMYLGNVVEQGSTEQIFEPPCHPYTQALFSAIPIADTRYTKRRLVLEGDIPSATDPRPGCPFQTRNPKKGEVQGTLCKSELPPLRDLGIGYFIRRHLEQSVLDAIGPVSVAATATARI
jgi:peptide/nickel transport system ATP-binding protein